MPHKNKTRLNKKISALMALITTTTLLTSCQSLQHVDKFINQADEYNNIKDHKQTPQTKSDLQSLAQAAIEPISKQQPFNNQALNYQNGVFIINDNRATINFKNTNRAYVQLSNDDLKRPTRAVAVLNKNTRQYQDRNQTNNGTSDFKPLGYHQLKLTNSSYPWAYNRGHLIGYALAGNLATFDASESNSQNIITETSWANQSQDEQIRGQNYYEGLIRKALDQNKTVMYAVEPLYLGSELVARGIWLQAKSTDNSINFNVVIPNVQKNLNIDYATGNCNQS